MSAYSIGRAAPTTFWWETLLAWPRSRVFLLLGDAFLILLSQLIATKIRVGVWRDFFSLSRYDFLLLILFIGTFHLLNLYNVIGRAKRYMLAEICTAGVIVAGAGALLNYGMARTGFGRGVLVLGILFSVGFTFLLRVVVLVGKSNSVMRTVVIARAGDVLQLYSALSERPDIALSGYLCSEPGGSGPVPWLGFPKDLPRVVSELRPAQIVFESKEESLDEEIQRSLLRYRFAGVSVFDMASFYQMVNGRTPLSCVDDQWLLWASGFNVVSNAQVLRLKRLLDFILAAIGLAVSAPIILLVAIATKLDSRGPIYYRQQRLGFREKPFELMKFRSMVVPKDGGQPRWTAVADERVTRVGRIIRRGHLDELPQFWNVLKGDMSFVGPRPEQVPIAKKLREITPYYSFRHSIRPGITGWAQINNGYCASEEDSLKKLEYDLYYVQHMSLRMDLYIVMRTIMVVLTGKGSR